MRYNIFKLYLIKIAKWFMLIMPVVKLFLDDNGLNNEQLFILRSVYSVIIVILEIPSGYLGDIFGRKLTLMIGTFCGFFGYLCYSFSYGFLGFLIAEIILGLGQSFISGSDSAMLYDTLLYNKNEREYTRYEGRITALGNTAEALAGFIGPLLALISLRIPYYAQTAVAFIGIPAALTLKEPPVITHKLQRNIKAFLSVFDYVRSHPVLLRNLFISAIIGTATLSMAWLIQIYLVEIKIPVAMFGIIWTSLNISVAIGAILAYRIVGSKNEMGVQIGLFCFIVVIYFVLGHYVTKWAIGIFVLFYFVRGIATPVLKDYINKYTKSDIRATVLSIRSMIIRLPFAGIAPFFGRISDNQGIGKTYTMASVIFFVSGMLAILLTLRNKK